LYITTNIGLCPGAIRSLRTVEEAIAAASGRPVMTLGPILHNPQVLESLSRRGVAAAKSVSDIPSDAIIVLRAHGTTIGDMAELNARGAIVFDGTCENVKMIHAIVDDRIKAGRTVFYAGEAGHAEVRGCLSRGGGKIIHIETVNDSKTAAPDVNDAVLIAQTSYDKDGYDEIAAVLKSKMPDIEVIDTLCPYMMKAREEAATLSRRVEVMIVVGGSESSNTRRMAERCSAAGAVTYKIETSIELNEIDFTGVKTIGIASGASTPADCVEEILDWFREKCGNCKVNAVE